MGSVANGTLVVNSWVAVHDGCEMSYSIAEGSGVMFGIGGTNRRRDPGGDEEFEFWFETEALREFLALGARALAELDGAAAERAADRSLPAVGEGRDDALPAREPG